MAAVASSSNPITGFVSAVGGSTKAFGVHQLLFHPHTHPNPSFLPYSTTSISNILKLKTLSIFHRHLLLPGTTSSHTRKCYFAIASNYNEIGEEIEEPSGVDDEDEGNGEEELESRRLYVGNLPFSLTESQLSSVFQEAGRVDTVEVVYDRVTDRSRGFAFVTMGSVEEAKEAIRMFDGSQIGGRTAKVNFPEVPKGAEREVMGPRIRQSYRGFIDSPYKVYAGNLGWSITSDSLKEAFQDQPGMLGAKVIYQRDTGRSRGYGFVSFSSAEEAEAALNALNGVELEGRPLRLSPATQRERADGAASPTMQQSAVDSLSNAMQSSLG